MEKMFLVNVEYDEKKSRIMCKFSNNLEEINKHTFIHSEKFYPSFFINLRKDLTKTLLSDFSKNIIVTEKRKALEIKAKDYETLQKCKKILQLSTNKNILLIEPERQFLIDSDWSYYDTFYLVENKKINKISQSPLTNLNFILKKIINNLDLKISSRINQVTKKIILTNYLKKKITKEITTTQTINYIFENNFYKKGLPQPQESLPYNYENKQKKDKTIKIDITEPIAYLLTKENNIGYESLNCQCCKPRNIHDKNVLSNSLINVSFLKDGYYYISKDYFWSKEYHIKNKEKEKRESYKKQNSLTSYPVGPFYRKDSKKILLIDALRLKENKEIEIQENHEYRWFCKKEKAFVSEIIKDILNLKQVVEKSINLTTSLNYSNNSLGQVKKLEKNTLFYLYHSEKNLYTHLLKETISFIQNKNTKFYKQEIDLAIKSIKQKTCDQISQEECRFSIRKETIRTKDRTLLEKINNYFPKINIPVPEISF